MLNRLIALGLAATGIALPALAQGAPAGGASGTMMQLLLPIGMVAIFYFLLIRPQQQRAKKHAAMVADIKRGDTVVTSGGFIGKVTKAGDTEITVEIADNVRVQVIKSMVIEVRGKNAPVAAND